MANIATGKVTGVVSNGRLAGLVTDKLAGVTKVLATEDVEEVATLRQLDPISELDIMNKIEPVIIYELSDIQFFCLAYHYFSFSFL